MKEDNFDFNSYSRIKISDEEQEKLVEETVKYLDLCMEEKRKTFYSLPNAESKVNWLKKAVVNCEALNFLLKEFMPQVADVIPDQIISKEELEKLLIPHVQHVSEHMFCHITSLYMMKLFCEKTRKEKEEIETLKEMMR